MEQPTMDGAITPAAELAFEADASNMPSEMAHPDWTQILQSYDQEHAREAASLADHMQRYDALFTCVRATS